MMQLAQEGRLHRAMVMWSTVLGQSWIVVQKDKVGKELSRLLISLCICSKG